MKNYNYTGLIVLGLLLLSMVTVSVISTKERNNYPLVVEENNENDYLDVIDSRFKDRSIGSRTKKIVNGTIAVKDPTGNNNVYTIDANAGLIELNASRGQTSRHYYNTSSGEYTFSSDYMVIEPGVIEGTNWVTMDEFPNRLVVRMNDGKIHALESSKEITSFFSTSDNSSIWAVGLETFTGMMGFYFNTQDTDGAHGQYLYWPRLTSGRITSYDKPLYEWYTRIQAELREETLDAILQDRTSLPANPVNNLQVDIIGDSYNVYYSVENQKVLEATCDLVHGFKYTTGDDSFHTITEFRSLDTDFDDLGVTYELLTAPQVSGTDHEIESFTLMNGTCEAIINTQQIWEASTLVDGYKPFVAVTSKNSEGIYFDFSDMEEAGFTDNCLEYRETVLPGNVEKNVLSCGMIGYGNYEKGTWVEIDPAVTGNKSTDNYDLYHRFQDEIPFSFWYTSSTSMKAGFSASGEDTNYLSYVAIDTGIEGVITSTSSVTLSIYITSETLEPGEYIMCRVYNIGGNANGNTATESSTAYNLGTNTYMDAWNNPGSGSYKSANVETLTDYWGSNRDNDENFISFRMQPGTGCDRFTDDGITFYDSSYSSGSYATKLSFTYTLTDKYALVVSSYASDDKMVHTTHHFNDVLINDYGYTEKSILRLSCETSCGYCSESIDRDMITTESNFKSACAEVASWVQSTDEVVVWYCGHYDDAITYDVQMGESDTMPEADVANALADIANANPAEYYIIWDMCEAGNVLDALDNDEDFSSFDNWLAFGASHDNEPSHYDDYHISWWGYHGITCALNKSHDSFDDADDHDFDNDKVSMWELFYFAEDLILDLYEDQNPLQTYGASYDSSTKRKAAYIGD